MSDAKVLEALDQMESWLSDASMNFEAAELAEWNAAYFSAVATAERGPGWPSMVVRAHALGEQLNARLATMIVERDALKVELESFARGNRALKSYGANTR